MVLATDYIATIDATVHVVDCAHCDGNDRRLFKSWFL